MTCLGSKVPNPISASFSQARRPALIPANCALTAAEAEELVRPRTQQPLFPPPDPSLFQGLQFPSPPSSESSISDSPVLSIENRSTREQSPSSSLRGRGSSGGLPRAVLRDPRRRAAYLKARAQYARDRRIQQLLGPDHEDNSASLRKHSAFVVDEELHSQREGRADTPHLSEVLPGEDVIVEELDDDVEEPGINCVPVLFEDGNEEAPSGPSTIPRSAPEKTKLKQD